MTDIRFSEVQAGDSIRIIALRETGDAMRWAEIARLNGLRYPYIVASIDPADRLRGTLIWGDPIQLPGGSISEAPLEPDVLYGRDITLKDGYLRTDEGDWVLVEGVENLSDALNRRIITPTGDLLPHRTYGCDVRQILGFKIRPIAAMLGAGQIKAAITLEPRVKSVDKIVPDDEGDVARFAVTVVPVSGTKPLDINLVLPWGIA